MKKLLAATLCSISTALTPVAFAQSAAPGAGAGAGGAGAPATSGSTATPGSTAPTGAAPAAQGNTGTAGSAGTMGNTGTTGDAGRTAAPTAPGNSPAVPGGGAPAANDAKENITGLSVKQKIMGKTVVNENDDKIGEINDVVLASDGKAIYFIVGAGGFLGMGERDVAIPFNEINQTGDKLVLSGYTKDQLKALPKVEIAD